jgi:pyruvate,water dikinase
MWVKERKALKDFLLKIPAERITDFLERKTVPRGVDIKDWKSWQKKFRTHLKNFGHIIYDLDFMKAVSADHPDPLFDTMKFYMQGKGSNPYERQKKMVEQRERDVKKILARIGPIRRWGFKKLLKWAQTYAPVREDGLADVALAWPLVRQMLFELGRRLKQAKALQDEEEIFWLKKRELSLFAGKLDRGTKIKSFKEKIDKRKELWNQQRKLTPLVMYPEDYRFFGFKVSAFLPKTKQEGENIEGIGASQGKVTGKARVILSPDEFHLMEPGEILVTAITTPAWTPLFAIASGIVTDVGGPLSHSSIVAREYGVPAVLGTGMASKMIKSGQVITVDGDAGIVTLQ